MRKTGQRIMPGANTSITDTGGTSGSTGGGAAGRQKERRLLGESGGGAWASAWSASSPGVKLKWAPVLGAVGDLRFPGVPGDLGSERALLPPLPPPPPPLTESIEVARVARKEGLEGGTARGACCAFHTSGSNAPWLGRESIGQPLPKAALRPVRCGDSR